VLVPSVNIFDYSPDISHEEQYLFQFIRYVVVNENRCVIMGSFLGFIQVFEKLALINNK
jgi:hypothetical protein